MIAKVIRIIIEVEAHEDRDLDKQCENLLNIPFAQEVDFRAGWFGGQSYWHVMFDANEKFNLTKTLAACEKATKTRKSKNANSKTLDMDCRRAYDRADARAAKSMGHKVYETRRMVE